MCTSKLLGAVCTGAILLSAGCSTKPETTYPSAPRVGFVSSESPSVAFLDERPGQVVAITFGFDQDTLDQQAKAVLDAQAVYMNKRPDLRFSVVGHADRVGDTSYNLDLGRRRAERVLDYLAKAGIERDRLQGLVSHGEDRPLVETEFPERLNRRVVIEVAGLVGDAETRDVTPWWQHTPRPHSPSEGGGSTGKTYSSLSAAPAPSGNSAPSGSVITESSSTRNAAETTPASTSFDAVTSSIKGLGSGRSSASDNPTQVDAQGSGTTSTSNDESPSDPQPVESTTSAGGSSTVSSGTDPTTPSATAGNQDGNPTVGSEQTPDGPIENSGGPIEDNQTSPSAEEKSPTTPGKGKGSSGKSKGKGSKGPKDASGTPKDSNPSNDRVDAGGGNGPETGGDPGQSGTRNKGGDND